MESTVLVKVKQNTFNQKIEQLNKKQRGDTGSQSEDPKTPWEEKIHLILVC